VLKRHEGRSGGFARALLHHQIHIAIEYVQECKQLPYRFPVVGLIDQPVELTGRCAEPADDFPLAELARCLLLQVTWLCRNPQLPSFAPGLHETLHVVESVR
jgi:hypothetical protein